MGILGKRIIVFTMLWVLLVMAVSQIYDNVTGKGMPAGSAPAAGAPEPTVGPDPGVARLADLQTCVAANPQDRDCAQELADLYYAQGQWPQAQANYERVAKLAPDDVPVLLKLAGTYIYQNKFAQAIPTLQDAAAIKPDAPELHLLLGLSLSKLDPPRMDEAAAEWRQVISLAPDSAWAQQARQYLQEAGR
jgi:tetratricopeptide (TPR) repeat protein